MTGSETPPCRRQLLQRHDLSLLPGKACNSGDRQPHLLFLAGLGIQVEAIEEHRHAALRSDYASKRFNAAATALRSAAASCPSRRRMKRLSSVNSFMRTSDAAARPAALPSVIATSWGQAAFPDW